ncbi:Membrane-bound transcription factor site-2 protease [Pseudolycoriella hygida]|uniref:Membrane-bound transcription factor site-2 protease n=1 Tax=Pseudolycoriella hygida TaxID=35572 RepID=A0A9Q0NG33_9DIPT|nr:Membrane-bound transcription factor site-2 protease [Pseudolycoriella hygida]
MDLATLTITVGIIYGVLFFFDSIFKSCVHYPYLQFLHGTGLTVKFCRLQWYTTAFNRTLIKWSNKYPRFFATSFDLGVWISILLLPVIFAHQIFSSLFKYRTNSTEIDIGLEIMLPGVNLPIDEIGYYVAALVVGSVIHELGHGLAAVLEDVPVTGFGFYIFLIFPIAYTTLGTEQLNSLNIWRKLRVICAGIWHNIMLSFVLYVCFLILPTIFAPLYHSNVGVSITNIKSNSRLLGEKGLQTNDIVTHINGCQVKDLDSWYGCLLESIRQQPAYCISNDFVLNHDESIHVYHTNEGLTECCDRKNMRNLCFEYISESNGVLELPQFMCLNVRNVVENSFDYCHKTVKCHEHFCIKPILDNATTVIHLKRLAKNDVMYMGHPADLSRTIKVSNFVAKTKLFTPSFIDGIVNFIKYVVVFSFGMAVVNAIPCFAFDGQFIVSALVHHILQTTVSNKKKRDLIAFVITLIGSALFALAMFRVIWNSGLKSFF